jgi:hypothetical protein
VAGSSLSKTNTCGFNRNLQVQLSSVIVINNTISFTIMLSFGVKRQILPIGIPIKNISFIEACVVGNHTTTQQKMYTKVKKVKLSMQQAVRARRVVRRRGFDIL